MSAGLYLWLLSFLVVPRDVTAINGTLGSLFVLAFPRLTFGDNPNQANITCHVGTFSETPFQVTFQFIHSKEPGRDKQTQVIRRGKFSTFVVNKTLWDERNFVRKGVFKVNGHGRFGLTVLMFGNNRDMSTFTAVPVEAWGTEYYTVALDFNPAFQIVSAEKSNRLKVHYVISSYFETGSINLTFENSELDSTKMIQTFELKSYESISISFCQDEPFRLRLTASNISGEIPFGVVSGSCTSYSFTTYCSDRGHANGLSSDPVTEMLAPTGHWGTEFIVMTIPARMQQGSARVINSDKRNRVDFTVSDPNYNRKFLFLLERSHVDVRVRVFNLRLNTKYPVQVAYMQCSACIEKWNWTVVEPTGDPSYCMITPNNLFFVRYIWMLPETPTTNYAALVSETENCQFITLDDNPLPSSFIWENVSETPTYSVGHLKLTSGYNEFGSSSFKKFGCYFYGLAEEVMFMHPGGYQACDSTIDVTVGDLIDNDCDGSIDEEIADYFDDDDDGLIDEDTRKSPKVDGHWGDWEEWFCNPDCGHTKFVRLRHCNNPQAKGHGKPCVGDFVEFHHLPCETEKSLFCPDQKHAKKHDEQPVHRVCGFKRWGPNCTSFCTHCVNDCDEHTGACTHCLRGYKNAAAGCGKVCDVNEFGFDCSGSCLEKCGMDCLEREHGKCPTNRMQFLVVLAALPVLLLTIGLCLKCSRRPRKEKKLLKEESVGKKMPLEGTLNEQAVHESDLGDNQAASEDNKSQAGSVVRSIYSTKSNVTNPSLIGSNVDP